MNDVLLAARSSLESKSIGISTVRIGKKRPAGRKYMGDRYRLEHALLHIISNAIKQAPFGTSLVVTVQERDENTHTIRNSSSVGGESSWSLHSSMHHNRSNIINPVSTSTHGINAMQQVLSSNNVTPRGSISHKNALRGGNMTTMLAQNFESWGLLGGTGPGKIAPMPSPSKVR